MARYYKPIPESISFLDFKGGIYEALENGPVKVSVRKVPVFVAIKINEYEDLIQELEELRAKQTEGV